MHDIDEHLGVARPRQGALCGLGLGGAGSLPTPGMAGTGSALA
jgi:hypothetical protein